MKPEEAHPAEVSMKQAVSGTDAEEWYRAMAAEVKSIIRNDTWKLVERLEDHKVIGRCIVLKNKYKPGCNFREKESAYSNAGFCSTAGN